MLILLLDLFSFSPFVALQANSSSYLQPPVPGPSARPNAFTPMFSSPVSVPKGLSSNTPSFSYNGNTQSMQNDQSLKDVRYYLTVYFKTRQTCRVVGCLGWGLSYE